MTTAKHHDRADFASIADWARAETDRVSAFIDALPKRGAAVDTVAAVRRAARRARYAAKA